MRSLRGTSAVRKVQRRVITEATKMLKEMKAPLDRGASEGDNDDNESSASEGDNDDNESSEGESD